MQKKNNRGQTAEITALQYNRMHDDRSVIVSNVMSMTQKLMWVAQNNRDLEDKTFRNFFFNH